MPGLSGCGRGSITVPKKPLRLPRTPPKVKQVHDRQIGQTPGPVLQEKDKSPDTRQPPEAK